MVRHSSILRAVELLTAKREQACCVERDYVRKVYDFYALSEDYSKNKLEAKKIDISYIINWEQLHDSYVGVRRPEDLTVCYLCGPEPDNDFQEFLGLGILPQNIWAFETDNQAYKKAISTYDNGKFPQPRILKQNIETFFLQTPKKFDIIYIDACGSIPSSQHALRCISTICQENRLNSPGIIISNFAKPDMGVESINEYGELISQYLLFKYYPNLDISLDDNGICNEEYFILLNKVKKDFDLYYGEFISTVLRDIPSILIPIQRIARNPYLNQLFDINSFNIENEFDLIKLSGDHSIAKYFFTAQLLIKKDLLGEKSRCFAREIGNFEDLLLGLKLVVFLKQGKIKLRDDVCEIKQYFEKSNNIYQFLDKPHSNLLFDMIINQLAYPLHYNIPQNLRYQYIAKSTFMFTDVTVYDECRYIYEWLPAIHQAVSAFENISWQYVFRFALDGLVKMRQKYNNEFFFQGSIVPNTVKEFESKELAKRIIVE